MKYKISVIIPVYNEEKTIRAILDMLATASLVSEIICVNDGSTDSTLQTISQYSTVKVISLERNYGKSFAISKGIEEAVGDIIVFLDGDLIGLTKQHILSLIQPLEKGEYKSAVGYPGQKLGKFFIPLSGERAYFKKDILPYIQEFQYKGFGLELYLNYMYRREKIKIVELKGVGHILKSKKFSFLAAIKECKNEIYEIIAEVMSQNKPISYIRYAIIQPFYLKKRL